MRSHSPARRALAAVLLLLAIVTEYCEGAERARPRDRSSPVRRVPVAANTKRDVDFDCPEEFGYYPHPTDCALYYVCVFGGALLESCTGGLMYSHELQTCDWPRNVGCDGATAAGGEDLERLIERDPPPPPPPRRKSPVPPTPRVQPNPIVTSRGQPKYSRNDYEKQQQLYADVDDLPPVEEIENDRQQRVYRGQPSTIGQVQKDRDGYVAQVVTSGRNFNTNIIPASITQNGGKIGSFSFGSQVDDRRQATITQAPQSYSDDKLLTDSQIDRRIDIETNYIDNTNKVLLRKKRDVIAVVANKTDSSKPQNAPNNTQITNRRDEFIEFVDMEEVPGLDDENTHSLDDSDRGKRQVRYYLKNGYKTSGKNWALAKPIKYIEVPQSHYNQNGHNVRYHQQYPNNNQYYDNNRKPYSLESNAYSVNNPFVFQTDSQQPYSPFKASLPDYSGSKNHNSLNIATQIITKSPPISALQHNENPFSSYSGDFYNNVPKHYQNNQFSLVTDRPSPQVSYKDSSLLPSTVVTGKPVITSPRVPNDNQNSNKENQRPVEEDYESYEEGSEEESEEDDSLRFPKPPYEFSHPSHKYANIENPFANPNFDFDAYLSKLSNGQYTTQRSTTLKAITRPVEITSSPHQIPAFKSSNLDYKGVSTPRPFTVTFVPNGAQKQDFKHSSERYVQSQQQHHPNTQMNQYTGHNNYQHPSPTQNSAGLPIQVVKPKLQPPNFKDDRQLPISYSFSRPIDILSKPNSGKAVSVTQNPFILLKATASPVVYSSPKQQQYVVSSDKVISLSPYGTTVKPSNAYSIYKQSTPNPLTTVADKQLYSLQKYWRNSTSGPISAQYVTIKPSTKPDLVRLKNLFVQAIASTTQSSIKNSFHQIGINGISSTTGPPAKRRPIPKPSPEMNDYYYDDDEYYEPLVKPKYMPSTEVKPQRPPMAQNYKEYDDDSYENSEEIQTLRPNPTPNLPNTFKPDAPKSNYNDVTVVTKTNMKEYNKNSDGKVPIPVLFNYASPPPTVLIRPQGAGFKMIDRHRNRTMYFRKPVHESGPNTNRPPKYLNQTTLRPYTVRHRLAKPAPVEPTTSTKGRHPNIVAQMLTTPRDSHNQETRFTRVNHDGRTNSLEPTESVVPVSYSPSPRPKMLYNGSQTYSPDQYDPYYAIYDEDGELYKDTDYVQQYNSASLRPAVQQTYRGTPPPAPAPSPPRRPGLDNYTPRPITSDDYDDALIQGQINNQNQYQSAIRQSTRGDGNELGYDHHPSSVKTTLYEATPLSTITIPSTTSTSTTLRPTSAPFTEAMTPHRYTSRSSTDVNPIAKSESPSIINSSDESVDSVPTTPSPVINFSFLAKPFEKTDNIGRFEQTASTTTEKLPSARRSSVTNSNEHSLEVVRSENVNDKKKYVSLTTGFSIRRNANNSNNPYTLTVLTRPFEAFDKSRKNNDRKVNPKNDADRFYYDSSTESKLKSVSSSESNQFDSSSENQMRRKDSRFEVTDEFDIPVYVRPTVKPRYKSDVKATPPPTTTTKYYLKSIIKRPAPFSTINKEENDTDNNRNLAALIDTGLQNAQKTNQDPFISTTSEVNITPKRNYNVRIENNWNEPTVSPFISLDNIRNNDEQQKYQYHSTTTSTSTAKPSSTTERANSKVNKPILSRPAPSYYSYRLEDEFVPDQTTEVLSSTVKNVIKAFFNNFVSSPVPESTNRAITSTSRPSLPPHTTQKVVNIGFQKKPVKYVDEKPPRKNVNRLQIITESPKQYVAVNDISRDSYRENNGIQDFSSTTPTMTTMSTSSFAITSPATTPIESDSLPFQMQTSPSFQSKFSDIVTIPDLDIPTEPTLDITRKFQNIINVDSILSQDKVQVQDDDESVKNRKTIDFAKLSEIDWNSETSDSHSEIASTTSTTKATTTTTLKVNPTKSTSKSASFPTRASRVNPAIKLAASNPGSGRRSYQSPSKCSTDNSLQANPKCNEIKYQRPSSTRGRGSAHYSTLSGNESPQQTPNRGTPPTRSRPTLKPSTAIVSESTKFVDIYSYPPSRPAPVYPQPTPDKTAAKCRKDVCLLPDCYCGGKDIPGNLPVDEVPQIVLITFDDAVNDLNKLYYEELFEKGRVNPNGCPISATFYVSHEWTDYSQVQNLYAGGHELASHTISHSFGEQFSQKKWNREVAGQREILSAYGGVKLEDVRGMRAPFLSIGGNKMFKMLHDSNFTYDSSMPVYENRPPSWPYTLDYKIFHDCMIPPCPTKSYPGVWEVPMVMWQDLNGGRCSMGDACANPPEAEGVYKMLLKNFDRHYTTNRAPFGLYYHAAWFTQPHHKEGFIMFLDFINQMQDVWIVTNWQALQWVRDPTPISRLNGFQPFQCNYQDRPKKCNNPKVCNLWHKSGVRYMRTCQPCPEVYPWTGKSGIRSSRIDNDNGE